MTRLELFRLKSMWGNFNFDYACSMARGRSGGLISMWDPNMFSKDIIWCDDYFIIVKGAMTIDRMWSDHSPILLHVKKSDFGPSPFKLYNTWLNRDGFDDLIKSTWASIDTTNGDRTIRSHEKLRGLKAAIKKWHVDLRNNDRSQKHITLSEIKDIEIKIDNGSASTSDREKRTSSKLMILKWFFLQ
ncbi:Ribonuclease H domain [Artemisia annua]|uniref:Ribonuclease H domain n=1 Tax=Artemisia annua TaxID=35608 RepID=A0A2U1M5N9_ARTAN|nr:Ribonuclease H domain [Artemisia annua]